MLQLHRFVFNPFSENTYLVWDEDSKEAAVIDPGMNDSRERKVLQEFITVNSLVIKYCINTHCHIDHVLGNTFVKKNYEVKFLIPKADEFLFNLIPEQAKMFGINVDPSPKPDAYIEDFDKMMLGNKKGNFISTPGHTPGEICLYFESEKILFSGDVLFRESIGRTDLWGGNYEVLISSIKNKLFTLPGDVVVYPGHESSTTIKYEIENNPFLKD